MYKILNVGGVMEHNKKKKKCVVSPITKCGYLVLIKLIVHFV